MGRGALSVAQRPIPLRVGSAAIGVSDRREITETAVRSDSVVVVFPEPQGLAGMRERVRVMGGRFSIRSGGEGTTVDVMLPVSE